MNCGHAPIPTTEACPTCPPPDNWTEAALCRQTDPDLFYPRFQTYARPALDTCSTCPVRPYCLEEGWMEEWGIWGGWTEQARADYRAANRRPDTATIRALATKPNGYWQRFPAAASAVPGPIETDAPPHME